MTLVEYRENFEQGSNRAVSMPIAGAIVWAVVAALSTQVDSRFAVYILLFATGAIFPLALLIAKFRHENLVSAQNPLAKLMGMCVLMVNLLWAVHIPLLLNAPEFVPLSLGVGLGLHWVVYSWIVSHPVGLIHAVLRAVLIVLAWYVFPDARVLAIASVIVLVYLLSIYQMLTRELVLDEITYTYYVKRLKNQP
ncbi:DUF7010 family protein [Rheinheimera salexigens]|uniref:Uncharacterized protein n=1 Tax=Rheinheimera salexigens TaxID=1628148 RepID=A0A1E7Q2N3_9GAMM|nr:hypothetical protein [Rheinheimera salexigens]OEY68370.1 hypothetical protein BI198_01400 [Rheinheimera salexigens]